MHSFYFYFYIFTYFCSQKEKSSTGNQATCRLARDDYLECLHHKKEILRNQAIQAEAARQAAGGDSAHGHGGH